LSLTIYETSVPVFIRALSILSAILDKASAHARANKLDPAELVEARLAPDMFTLARQVQAASDAAKSCAARLTGSDIPSFPDTEKTLPELQDRIAKTIAYLRSFNPSQFEGGAERVITLNLPGKPVTFQGKVYLLTFSLPNFFFHVTTAYDILRHKGLNIGKMDYLGAF
jgi:hypothetical protein